MAFVLVGTAEEVHRLCDNLAAIALVALLVGPFGVVDAAANQDLHALLAVFLDCLAEAVEGGDAMPFGILNPIAVLVSDGLPFNVAEARGGKREVGDAVAALAGAGFGLLTDVAGENDDILHLMSPLLLSEGPSLRRDPTKSRRMAPAPTQ